MRKAARVGEQAVIESERRDLKKDRKAFFGGRWMKADLLSEPSERSDLPSLISRFNEHRRNASEPSTSHLPADVRKDARREICMLPPSLMFFLSYK